MISGEILVWCGIRHTQSSFHKDRDVLQAACVTMVQNIRQGLSYCISYLTCAEGAPPPSTAGLETAAARSCAYAGAKLRRKSAWLCARPPAGDADFCSPSAASRWPSPTPADSAAVDAIVSPPLAVGRRAGRLACGELSPPSLSGTVRSPGRPVLGLSSALDACAAFLLASLRRLRVLERQVQHAVGDFNATCGTQSNSRQSHAGARLQEHAGRWAVAVRPGARTAVTWARHCSWNGGGCDAEGDAPGVVLDELRAAGALATVEGGQLVAAPALLAEALHCAVAHERRQLDVHLADAAALVVRCQAAQVPAAVLNLRRIRAG